MLITTIKRTATIQYSMLTISYFVNFQLMAPYTEQENKSPASSASLAPPSELTQLPDIQRLRFKKVNTIIKETLMLVKVNTCK